MNRRTPANLPAALVAALFLLSSHARAEDAAGLSLAAAYPAQVLWNNADAMQAYSSCLFQRPHQGQSVWLMGLGAFSRMGSQPHTPGVEGRAGGYALGAAAQVNARCSVGLSFGQLGGSNESAEGGARIHRDSLMAAAYLRHDSHAGLVGRRRLLDAYAACGRTVNRSRSSLFRKGVGGGRWSDELVALGLRISWERPLTERASLFPFIGLRYVHASHGRFSAEGWHTAPTSLQNLSLPLGFTLRSRYCLAYQQVLQPELSLGYARDISRRNPRQAVERAGQYACSTGAAPGRHALLLRAGVGWSVAKHWSAGAYYQLECRKHALGQVVDISVGYAF